MGLRGGLEEVPEAHAAEARPGGKLRRAGESGTTGYVSVSTAVGYEYCCWPLATRMYVLLLDRMYDAVD